jgi:solute carrier family 10 (sodium/bile acid cotransporter), member 7
MNMIEILKKYWFLVGLALVFSLTVLDPTNLIAAAGMKARSLQGPDVIIFVIFLFSGYLLNPDQIRSGLTDLKGTILALILIFVFAPVYAALISFLPLSHGILIGLFLVAVMPTTMSTGVVMTGASGGNPAHALFVSVLSNAMAVLTIAVSLPLLLQLTGEAAAVVLDSREMIIRIALLVLVPLMAGIAARTVVSNISIVFARRISIVNQLMILAIVWMGVAQAKSVLLGAWVMAGQIVVLVLCFHLIMLATAFGATRLFSLGRGRRESVIFMGSQKTLPLAVMLQVTLFPEYGQALIVCVLHHFVSLFVDGFLVGRLGRSVAKR